MGNKIDFERVLERLRSDKIFQELYATLIKQVDYYESLNKSQAIAEITTKLCQCNESLKETGLTTKKKVKELAILLLSVASLRKQRDNEVRPILKTVYIQVRMPSNMKAGKDYRIKFLLSSNKEDLRRSADYEILQVEVTDVITVKLHSDEAEITCLSNVQQMLLPDKKLEWHWDIKFLKSGNRRLSILISLPTTHPTLGSQFTDLDPVEQKVDIRLNALYTIGSLITKHAGLIAGTTLGTGAIWKMLKH